MWIKVIYYYVINSTQRGLWYPKISPPRVLIYSITADLSRVEKERERREKR